MQLTDHALDLWEARHRGEALPPTFVGAQELRPAAHLDMQAALQPYVDSSISKTINVPADFGFEDFKNVYEYAFEHGLKGCTTDRPNAVTGAVLEASAQDSKLCTRAQRGLFFVAAFPAIARALVHSRRPGIHEKTAAASPADRPQRGIKRL